LSDNCCGCGVGCGADGFFLFCRLASHFAAFSASANETVPAGEPSKPTRARPSVQDFK
jgi:hypothetical protein